METFEWYTTFITYTASVVWVTLFVYRLVRMHRYYVENGKWGDHSVDTPFDINTEDVFMGFLSTFFLTCVVVSSLLFIGILIDNPLILAFLLIMGGVIGAFIYVTKRERNKKVFHDKLSGVK